MEAPLSLMSLEDDLCCSICLSPFDCPVTIPCGHNFCQECLEATWRDAFTCPQCRTAFPSKPELRKNTVLSAVVDAFKTRSTGDKCTTSAPEAAEMAASPAQQKEKQKQKQQASIPCDICMEAEANQTCLTCMVSFCAQHLRPHLENPNFRLHQLREPVGDLAERICPDHQKLMELTCVQHGRMVCSFCMQQDHKGCSFITPEEQRHLREADLRDKLTLLDGKIAKNESAMSQMKDTGSKLTESATVRKNVLVTQYQQMRDMLDRDERDALSAVDRELESGQKKLQDLNKKFTQNVESMTKAKDKIYVLLGDAHSPAFLQASLDLPHAASFEPYAPRINLDSKSVKSGQSFAALLKDHLVALFKMPLEDRIASLRPGDKTVPAQFFSVAPPGPAVLVPESGFFPPMMAPEFPRSHSPGPGFAKAAHKKGQEKNKQGKKEENAPHPWLATFTENQQHPKANRGRQPADNPKQTSRDGPKDKPQNRASSQVRQNVSSAEKRHELLKYGVELALDPATAHKRIAMNADFTVASVLEEPAKYPDRPERFTVCSQVLAAQGFSSGRHYWEVKLSCNNFVGVGLAYGNIDRKGPTSRLGRNGLSWCIEWFNVKLSAWHDSKETVLTSSSPKRVGVLLDFQEGTATFFNVMDRAYPIHTFIFPFEGTVYPAFWMFSANSSITLCKLQA